MKNEKSSELVISPEDYHVGKEVPINDVESVECLAEKINWEAEKIRLFAIRYYVINDAGFSIRHPKVKYLVSIVYKIYNNNDLIFQTTRKDLADNYFLMIIGVKKAL